MRGLRSTYGERKYGVHLPNHGWLDFRYRQDKTAEAFLFFFFFLVGIMTGSTQVIIIIIFN